MPASLRFKRHLLIALWALSSSLPGLFTSSASAADHLHAWPASRPTPSLQLKDINGKSWNLADLHGKVVMLNFWATWCEPCVEEMPFLSQLADANPGRLVILGINFKESAIALRKFAAARQLGYPILPDTSGEHFKRWAGQVLPTTVLIDRQGKARWYSIGALDATDEDFRRTLERMLRE